MTSHDSPGGSSGGRARPAPRRRHRGVGCAALLAVPRGRRRQGRRSTASTARARSSTTRRGQTAAVDVGLGPPTSTCSIPAPISRNFGVADIVIVDGAPPHRSRAAVLVTLSPLRPDGPNSNRPGGEIVAQASGGLLATIEDGDGKPVPAPGYVALKAAGAVAALAALHGLDRRKTTGRRAVRRRRVRPGGRDIHRRVAGVRPRHLPLSRPRRQRPLPRAVRRVHLPGRPGPHHRGGKPPVEGVAVALGDPDWAAAWTNGRPASSTPS